MIIELKCVVFELCTKEQLSYKLAFGKETYKKSEFFEVDNNFYRKSFQVVPFGQIIKIYSGVDKNKLFNLLANKEHKFLLEFMHHYSESRLFV